DTSALRAIHIRVADLGGTVLGLAAGNSILLDGNAAGWGWFVDPTPRDDREFTTPGNQGGRNRMDLLTVVMHEMGHLLGHGHAEGGVMAETLAAGVREVPLIEPKERHDAATAAGFALYAGDQATRGLADDLFGRINDTGGI